MPHLGERPGALVTGSLARTGRGRFGRRRARGLRFRDGAIPRDARPGPTLAKNKRSAWDSSLPCLLLHCLHWNQIIRFSSCETGEREAPSPSYPSLPVLCPREVATQRGAELEYVFRVALVLPRRHPDSILEVRRGRPEQPGPLDRPQLLAAQAEVEHRFGLLAVERCQPLPQRCSPHSVGRGRTFRQSRNQSVTVFDENDQRSAAAGRRGSRPRGRPRSPRPATTGQDAPGEA